MAGNGLKDTNNPLRYQESWLSNYWWKSPNENGTLLPKTELEQKQDISKADSAKRTLFSAQLLEVTNILRSHEGISNVQSGEIEYKKYIPFYGEPYCQFLCNIRFSILGIPAVMCLTMREESEIVSQDVYILESSRFLQNLKNPKKPPEEFEL